MERFPILGRLASLIFLVALLAWARGAHAHPHMWIDARATVVFNQQGGLAAIDQTWLFDEMFTSYAMQGQAKDKKGDYSAETLKAMADDWMDALGDPQSHYFTRVTVNGQSLKLGEPREARVQWHRDTGRLGLSFVLPLAQPLPAGPLQADVDIFDPTFFVAYAFEPKTVALRSAPAQCAHTYRPPRELDWKTMQQLAAIPADPEALPDELFAITKSLTHRIEVRCP